MKKALRLLVGLMVMMGVSGSAYAAFGGGADVFLQTVSAQLAAAQAAADAQIQAAQATAAEAQAAAATAMAAAQQAEGRADMAAGFDRVATALNAAQQANVRMANVMQNYGQTVGDAVERATEAAVERASGAALQAINAQIDEMARQADAQRQQMNDTLEQTNEALQQTISGLKDGIEAALKDADLQFDVVQLRQINELMGELVESQKQIADAKVKAAAATAEGWTKITKRLTGFTNRLMTPEGTARVALLIFGAVAAKRGAGIMTRQVEKWLGQPTLVSETSVRSFVDILRGRKKPDEFSFDDIILAPQKLAQIKKIADQFTANMESGDVETDFKNILLYGPPGTGKTMFARILSKQSGMDYAIINAPSIFKFIQGTDPSKALQEMDRLFKWAFGNKKPVILFFDEIDALLPSRDKAYTQAAIQVVNNFLGWIQKPSSSQVAIVGATNWLGRLDEAARSRFGDIINFPLPAQPEREKLVYHYIKKEVASKGIKIASDVGANIPAYAQIVAGDAPRAIEELAKEFFRETRYRKLNVFTDKIARDVIAIKQKQKEEQRERERVEAEKAAQTAAQKAAQMARPMAAA